MIQIQPKNLEKTKKLHRDSIHLVSYYRACFCLRLFEVALGRNKIDSKVNSIQEYFSIPADTANSIVKKYATKDKRKHVKQRTILGFLKRQDPSLVSPSKKKKEFEEYIKILLFIIQNFNDIILSKPLKLLSINEEFKKLYPKNSERKIKELLFFIFPYESLSGQTFFNGKNKWNSYMLTAMLDIQVCPYCNRSWVNTVTEGVRKTYVVNPQLDHFFSKEKFPLLRLSFYNLIPSCETCNARLKNRIEFDENNLHPYLEEYGNDVSFKAIPKDYSSTIGIGNSYEIELVFNDTTNKAKVEKNHEVFEIKKIYEAHGDVISELYRKKFISNNKYLEILKKQYPYLSRNQGELYRLAFGNYFNEHEFHKRPFAKLTKDIAKDIGLI